MDAGEFVAVGIDLRNEDGVRLADDGRLFRDDSLLPVGAEIDAVGDVGLGWESYAGDFGEGDFGDRHERVRSESWICAWGWCDGGAEPRVHVGDHGAPEKANRKRCLRILARAGAGAALWREWNGIVLQAGEEVDADARIDVSVFLCVGSCVNERGGAAPVFVRSVREENLGENFFGDGAIEETAFFAGERIGFGFVGEREDIGGEKDGGSGLGVAGGLSEAMIEAAAASAGYMRENAVDGDAAFFVGIETMIEKMAEEAAVLRNAFGYDAHGGSDGVGGMFCVGSEIAEGGEAEAGNDRISDDVNIFVDAAGLKTAAEMDGAIAGREFA